MYNVGKKQTNTTNQLDKFNNTLLEIRVQLGYGIDRLQKKYTLKQIKSLFKNAKKQIENAFEEFSNTLKIEQFSFELDGNQAEIDRVGALRNKADELKEHYLKIFNAEHEVLAHNIIQSSYRAFKLLIPKKKKILESVDFEAIFKQITSLAKFKNIAFYRNAKTKLIDLVENYADSKCEQILEENAKSSSTSKKIEENFTYLNQVLIRLTNLEKTYFPAFEEKTDFPKPGQKTYTDLRINLNGSKELIIGLNKKLERSSKLTKSSHRKLTSTLNQLFEFSKTHIEPLKNFFSQVFQKTSVFFTNRIQSLVDKLKNRSESKEVNDLKSWQGTMNDFFQFSNTAASNDNLNASLTLTINQEQPFNKTNPDKLPIAKESDSSKKLNANRLANHQDDAPHQAIETLIAFKNKGNLNPVAAGEESAANAKIYQFIKSLKKKYPNDDIFNKIFLWMKKIKHYKKSNNKDKKILLEYYPDKVQGVFSFSNSLLDSLLNLLTVSFAKNFFHSLNSPRSTEEILASYVEKSKNLDERIARLTKDYKETREQLEEMEKHGQKNELQFQEIQLQHQKNQRQYQENLRQHQENQRQYQENLSQYQEVKLRQQEIEIKFQNNERKLQDLEEKIEQNGQKIQSKLELMQQELQQIQNFCEQFQQAQNALPSASNQNDQSSNNSTYSSGFFKPKAQKLENAANSILSNPSTQMQNNDDATGQTATSTKSFDH